MRDNRDRPQGPPRRPHRQRFDPRSADGGVPPMDYRYPWRQENPCLSR